MRPTLDGCTVVGMSTRTKKTWTTILQIAGVLALIIILSQLGLF